jgi:hypothetical protein
MGNGDSEANEKPGRDEHLKVDTDALENNSKDPREIVRSTFKKQKFIQSMSFSHMIRQPMTMPILRPRISAV